MLMCNNQGEWIKNTFVRLLVDKNRDNDGDIPSQSDESH